MRHVRGRKGVKFVVDQDALPELAQFVTGQHVFQLRLAH